MVRTIAVMMSIALTGCAASSGSGPGTSTAGSTQVSLAEGHAYQIELTREGDAVSAVVPGGPGDVWRVLARVYRDIGLEPGDLDVYDPAERRIGVAGHRVPRLAGKRLSLLLNCGQTFGTPLEDTGDVLISLTTWLRPHDDGTQVLTRFEGRLGQRGAACASRGRLEQEIATRIIEGL